MSKFIARKERLVEDFISTISDLDSKSCDEIENSLYEIIKKTRGLIYADQYRQKTDKHANYVSRNLPISRLDAVIIQSNTTSIRQHEKIY